MPACIADFAVRAVAVVVGLAACTAVGAEPTLPGVGPALEAMVDAHEIAGAVTLVVDRDGVLHEACTGFADIAAGRRMTPDTIFWIASMSKPVTGVAVLMLVDEGGLALDDLVDKHLPAFANLATPSEKPARLTVAQLLTHTLGLGEAGSEAAQAARALATIRTGDLPTGFFPGRHGRSYGWGIGTCVLREPHEGVAALLAPGTAQRHQPGS